MLKRSAFALVLFASSLAGFAQQPATHRATSTPYKGDPSIFDSPGREQRVHVDRVMDALQISAGKKVADIGAGSGWFTVLAARRVGQSGTVYAVDINPAVKTYIDKRARKEGLTNVETVLSAPDDPRLPANSVDSVLILKTYHEIENPVELMRNLRAALRPGARVGIIDRNGDGTNHGVERAVVMREAEEAGYRLLSEQDFVKDDGMDYFLIFVAKEQS
jgi:cyclopropane fatty-acyl-phospholipid synthase-like methyltransferase